SPTSRTALGSPRFPYTTLFRSGILPGEAGRLWTPCSGAGLDVGEAQLAPGDQLSIRIAADEDLPQLLGASLVDGASLGAQQPGLVAAQHVGAVGDPDRVPQATAQGVRIGPHRRDRLHQGAVHASVDEPERLMVLALGVEGRLRAVGGDLAELQVDVIVERGSQVIGHGGGGYQPGPRVERMVRSMPNRIVTLTLSPSIDLSTSTPIVRPEHKLRCTPGQLDPGGGGLNVSRVAHELGADTFAVFPSGGATGRLLEECLSAADIPFTGILAGHDTRICFNAGESESGREFRFVLPGAPLTPEEVEACILEVEEELETGDVRVASGS